MNFLRLDFRSVHYRKYISVKMLKQKITKNEVLYFAVYVCDAKLQIAC